LPQDATAEQAVDSGRVEVLGVKEHVAVGPDDNHYYLAPTGHVPSRYLPRPGIEGLVANVHGAGVSARLTELGDQGFYLLLAYQALGHSGS